MPTRFFLFLLIMTLAGCGTVANGTFDNRIACAVAKDKAFVVSQYGPVGVASTIAAADAAVVCK